MATSLKGERHDESDKQKMVGGSRNPCDQDNGADSCRDNRHSSRPRRSELDHGGIRSGPRGGSLASDKSRWPAGSQRRLKDVDPGDDGKHCIDILPDSSDRNHQLDSFYYQEG